MVCKEVSTCPRIMSSKKNVVVSRAAETSDPGGVSSQRTQTTPQLPLPYQKYAQTSRSLIHVHFDPNICDVKRSFSEANIATPKINQMFDADKPCVNKEPKNSRYKNVYVQKSRPAQSDDRKSSHHFYNRNKDFIVFHAAVTPCTVCSDNVPVRKLSPCSICYDNILIRKVIRAWLQEVPLKKHDFLGRPVKKEQILSYIVCRLKIIPEEIHIDSRKLRTEVMDIVDDVPFDAGNCNINIYLNKLTDDLLSRLEHAKVRNCYDGKNSKTKFYNRNTYIVNNQHTTSNANDFNMFKATTSKQIPSPAPVKSTRKGILRPSGTEVQDFVRAELLRIVENAELVDVSKLSDIETDLIYILFESLDNASTGKDDETVNEISWLFRETGGLLRQQAERVAEKLLKQFKYRFLSPYKKSAVDSLCATSNIKMSEKECDNTSRIYKPRNSFSTQSISTCVEDRNINTDKKKNVEWYITQLENVIKQWLASIIDDIPQVRDLNFRQSVVNELIEDIMYRQRYLELSPRIRVAMKTELEHLRYQIFKWVNKLVGDNSMVALVKVPELMKAIRCIDIPVVSNCAISYSERATWEIPNTLEAHVKPETQSRGISPFVNKTLSAINLSRTIPIYVTHTKSVVDHTRKEKNRSWKRNSKKQSDKSTSDSQQNKGTSESHSTTATGSELATGTSTNSAVKTSSGNVSSAPEAATSGATAAATAAPATAVDLPDIKKIEAVKLDNFFREWVLSVPVIINEPNSEELISQVRTGLYHGIGDIAAKVYRNMDEDLRDEFFLQDYLHGEIDKLLDFIPPEPEFVEKKHMLKHNLVQRIVAYFKMINYTVPRDEFIVKLKKNLVELYVPRTKTVGPEIDPVQLFEDFKIIMICEEYIMSMAYRDEDVVKCNIHKKRLLQHVKEFVQELKEKHKAELKDIDPDLYTADILNTLAQVPLPSDETIKEEAEEILFKLEVERWLNALPLSNELDAEEVYRRLKVRDLLARKLYEWEVRNRSGLHNESAEERALLHEVSDVLQKLPLERDATLQFNYYASVLTNRIKEKLKAERTMPRTGGFAGLPNQSQPPCSGQPCSPTQDRSQQPAVQQSPVCAPYYVPGGLPVAPVQPAHPLTYDGRMPGRYASQSTRRVLLQRPPLATIPQGDVFNNTIPIQQYLERYEDRHPPYASPNRSMQFGPTRSRLIQNPDLFGKNVPLSSSMNEQMYEQTLKLGNLSAGQPNPCQRNICESYSGQQNFPTRQSSLEQTMGLVSFAQENVAQQSMTHHGTSQRSLGQHSVSKWGPPPASMSNKTQSSVERSPNMQAWQSIGSEMPQPSTRVAKQPHDQSAIEDISLFSSGPVQSGPKSMPQSAWKSPAQAQHQPGISALNIGAHGSLQQSGAQMSTRDSPGWLQKYIQNYEAGHPDHSAHSSMPYGIKPGFDSVLYPPNYAVFGAERPAGSSFQQVGSLLDESIGVYEPCGAPGIGIIEASRCADMNNVQIGPGLYPGASHNMSGPCGMRQGLVPYTALIGAHGAAQNEFRTCQGYQGYLTQETSGLEHASRGGLPQDQHSMFRHSKPQHQDSHVPMGLHPAYLNQNLPLSSYQHAMPSYQFPRTIPTTNSDAPGSSQASQSCTAPCGSGVGRNTEIDSRYSELSQACQQSVRHPSPGRVFGIPGELVGLVSRSAGPGIGMYQSPVRESPTVPKVPRRGVRDQCTQDSSPYTSDPGTARGSEKTLDRDQIEEEESGDSRCYCSKMSSKFRRRRACYPHIPSCVRITASPCNGSFMCPYYHHPPCERCQEEMLNEQRNEQQNEQQNEEHVCSDKKCNMHNCDRNCNEQ